MRRLVPALLLLASCSSSPPPKVDGALVHWQPVVVSFSGPESRKTLTRIRFATTG
ncbi:MAG: hypothetical protein R2724_31230 [Bryobacterales bacterium]